jgi:hypothetical protein
LLILYHLLNNSMHINICYYSVDPPTPWGWCCNTETRWGINNIMTHVMLMCMLLVSKGYKIYSTFKASRPALGPTKEQLNWKQSGQGVKLINHPDLLPNLRMGGAKPTLPAYSFMEQFHRTCNLTITNNQHEKH